MSASEWFAYALSVQCRMQIAEGPWLEFLRDHLLVYMCMCNRECSTSVHVYDICPVCVRACARLLMLLRVRKYLQVLHTHTHEYMKIVMVSAHVCECMDVMTRCECCDCGAMSQDYRKQYEYRNIIMSVECCGLISLRTMSSDMSARILNANIECKWWKCGLLSPRIARISSFGSFLRRESRERNKEGGDRRSQNCQQSHQPTTIKGILCKKSSNQKTEGGESPAWPASRENGTIAGLQVTRLQASPVSARCTKRTSPEFTRDLHRSSPEFMSEPRPSPLQSMSYMHRRFSEVMSEEHGRSPRDPSPEQKYAKARRASFSLGASKSVNLSVTSKSVNKSPRTKLWDVDSSKTFFRSSTRSLGEFPITPRSSASNKTSSSSKECGPSTMPNIGKTVSKFSASASVPTSPASQTSPRSPCSSHALAGMSSRSPTSRRVGSPGLLIMNMIRGRGSQEKKTSQDSFGIHLDLDIPGAEVSACVRACLLTCVQAQWSQKCFKDTDTSSVSRVWESPCATVLLLWSWSNYLHICLLMRTDTYATRSARL